MARVRVIVDGRLGSYEFEVNGDQPDFNVSTEPIGAWGLTEVPDRYLDLLDIAGAVFAADGMITRGDGARPRLGAAWHRRMQFRVDVRDTDFWRRKETGKALVDMLEFLTGDEFSFEFGTAVRAPPRQSYLRFGGDEVRPLEGEHVLLFSGGLDSLAGALEMLAQEAGRVVLVTHRSAQKNARSQDRLAESLRQKHSDRVAYIPIAATRKGERARETTQRSRSFLFAAFGFVIARLSGVTRLSFFENGVVSQNLPLSPQIIGTMATRTTHPLTLRKFSEFLSLIDGAPFEVRNPFQWITKKEVVEKIRDYGSACLIQETVSCNHVWKRTKNFTHCGACSQCLDRRFGILAAGLEANDPDDRYRTPVLTGDRVEDRSRIEAVEWTRHALRLERMVLMEFQGRYSGEIARIAKGHEGRTGDEILRRSHELQRRHGTLVRKVIEEQLSAHSAEIVGQALPGDCLLRLILGDLTVATDIPEMDITGSSWRAGVDAEDDLSDETVLILHERNGERMLEVPDLGSVSGAPAGPAFALHPQYEADKMAGLEPRDHHYVRPGKMVPAAGRSAGAAVQNVKRCRAELAELYAAIHDAPPPEPLLIENRKPDGYRLDPYVVVVRSGS